MNFQSSLLAHHGFSALLLPFGSPLLALATEGWGKCIKQALEALLWRHDWSVKVCKEIAGNDACPPPAVYPRICTGQGSNHGTLHFLLPCM